MADYGGKIALPGKDVSSLDIRDLALWSKFKLWKIEGFGDASFVDSTSIDIEGDKHFSVGVKESNKWYMAGASGTTNAGPAKLSSSAADWTFGAGFEPIFYNWTVACTGTCLLRYYYSIDNVSSIL